MGQYLRKLSALAGLRIKIPFLYLACYPDAPLGTPLKRSINMSSNDEGTTRQVPKSTKPRAEPFTIQGFGT